MSVCSSQYLLCARQRSSKVADAIVINGHTCYQSACTCVLCRRAVHSSFSSPCRRTTVDLHADAKGINVGPCRLRMKFVVICSSQQLPSMLLKSSRRPQARRPSTRSSSLPCPLPHTASPHSKQHLVRFCLHAALLHKVTACSYLDPGCWWLPALYNKAACHLVDLS